MPLHKVVLVAMGSIALTGCFSYALTGASLIYDRHNVYKKIDDVTLNGTVGHLLYSDNHFRRMGCAIDVSVFNKDILLVGHVPTKALRKEAEERASKAKGYRRLFNQIRVSRIPENAAYDAWITTRIKGKVIADSDIDPGKFKVVTSNRVVYLMGDVVPQQASKVIQISRQCPGVRRVVKLLKYYHLSDHATQPER